MCTSFRHQQGVTIATRWPEKESREKQEVSRERFKRTAIFSWMQLRSFSALILKVWLDSASQKKHFCASCEVVFSRFWTLTSNHLQSPQLFPRPRHKHGNCCSDDLSPEVSPQSKDPIPRVAILKPQGFPPCGKVAEEDENNSLSTEEGVQ